MSEQDIVVNAIAEHGDVVLVVGTETQRLVRKMKVNSHLLRAASVVFNAMLGPCFAEGQGLSFDQPKEIELPEDDAAAMSLICHVLHYKPAGSCAYPSPLEVIEIAKLADKYDLRKALWYASDAWLKPNESDNTYILSQRIEASVIMEKWNACEILTKQLLLTYTGPCRTLVTGSRCPRYVQIICLLQDRRNHILNTFHDHLMRIFRDGYSFKFQHCSCTGRYLNDLAKTLEEKKLYPREAAFKSLAVISAAAKTIPYPVDSTYQPHCEASNTFTPHTSPLQVRRTLQEKVEEMFDVKGLSYEEIVEV